MMEPPRYLGDDPNPAVKVTILFEQGNRLIWKLEKPWAQIGLFMEIGLLAKKYDLGIEFEFPVGDGQDDPPEEYMRQRVLGKDVCEAAAHRHKLEEEAMTNQVMIDLGDYRACSIQINPEDGHFITVVGGETMQTTTLLSLKEKIDDFHRVEAKQIIVDLGVLDREGIACRIIGINLGSGKVLTRPVGARGPFIVNVGENTGLVARLGKLEQEHKTLGRRIQEREVKGNFGYGRISSDEYPEKMRELQQSYDNAVALSKENAD